MGWVVYYREVASGREMKSPEAPTEQLALDWACGRLRDWDDVLFIEGPNGQTVSRRQIDDYCAQMR